ncbi:MAG TPA: alpha/beta hydrolase [Actinomycetota bacterium]|nr:alpha/beta hydrolase [Actinomycetota bacterium]
MPTPERLQHIARRTTVGLVAGAGAGALGFLGAAWYFSSELLDPARAGDPYGLKVLALDPYCVTLPATEATTEAGAATLQWLGGYGQLGPVVAETSLGARRALTARCGVELTVGTRTRIKRHAVEGTPATAYGLTYEEVEVPGVLGPMAAWLVPAGSDGEPDGPPLWTVAVHGRGHGRVAMLRMLPELHAAGATTLITTYRNDVGAPASPDGLYHLGDTEWEDLEAAVRYARRHGAERVVLVADSMGGAIAFQFLRRSSLAGLIAGLVLDSPVLDWHETLVLAAAQRHLPPALTVAAKRLARLRVGVDWDLFDQVRLADHLGVPALLIHGEADATVPVGPSDRLAAARSDLVTYVRTAGDHLDSWVVDRARCAAALSAFLASPALAGSRRAGDRREPGEGVVLPEVPQGPEEAPDFD